MKRHRSLCRMSAGSVARKMRSVEAEAQHGRSSSTAMTLRKVSGSNPAATTIRRLEMGA